jgi:hypothetical protein
MSDTPETDEQTFTFGVAQVNLTPADYKLVRAGFAQKLERERDEARREAENLQLKYWGPPPYSKKYGKLPWQH